MADMRNVKYELLGRKLRLEIDLDLPVGKTGKGNEMVATSGNWQKIQDPEGADLSLNLVVVRKEK